MRNAAHGKAIRRRLGISQRRATIRMFSWTVTKLQALTQGLLMQTSSADHHVLAPGSRLDRSAILLEFRKGGQRSLQEAFDLSEPLREGKLLGAAR